MLIDLETIITKLDNSMLRSVEKLCMRMYESVMISVEELIIKKLWFNNRETTEV